MERWLALYLHFELAALAVVAVAVVASLWRSYRRRHPRAVEAPPGFERTAERFTDPGTGLEMVVWFDPRTGERRYLPADRPGGRG